MDNIAALRDGATDGTLYRLTGEAILTFQTENRNQKYIQDESAAILIDDNAGEITTQYDLYDGITGLIGTLTTFAQMLQFVPDQDPGEASSAGNLVTPADMALDDLAPDHQAQLVRVSDVMIEPDGDTNFQEGTSYTLTDASGEGILRTAYPDLDYLGEPIPDEALNITAVTLQFGDQLQLVPRFLEDFEEMAAPTISVSPTTLSGFEYVEGEGPSMVQSFEVNASHLDPEEGGLTVSAGTYFEISMEETAGFGPSLDLVYEEGILEDATVYVRLQAGLDEGEYAGEVIISGGSADQATVSLSGAVVVPPELPYTQNFEAFQSMETLPAGWNVSDNTYGGDWGTGTSAGLRGNARYWAISIQQQPRSLPLSYG